MLLPHVILLNPINSVYGGEELIPIPPGPIGVMRGWQRMCLDLTTSISLTHPRWGMSSRG